MDYSLSPSKYKNSTEYFWDMENVSLQNEFTKGLLLGDV